MRQPQALVSPAPSSMFDTAHPGLRDRLAPHARKGGFLASIYNQLVAKGTLSPKQVEAAVRILDQNKPAAPTAKIGMAAISAMFEAAKASGKKKPMFVAGSIALNLAPAGGANPGAVYVKERGVYAGKIVNGEFFPTRDASANVAGLVCELAANPLETAMKYGRATGNCCLCNRKLTDPVSVEAGIGPICAGNWGL